MDISRVAKHTGIAASTLRFYEDKGLIRSIGRQGIKRVFAPNVLDKLAFINLARAAGFSLAELAEMFNSEGQPKVDRSVLLTKAAEIDKNIRQLKIMSAGLKHVAVCPEENHFECPTFQHLLHSASYGALAKMNKKQNKIRKKHP